MASKYKKPKRLDRVEVKALEKAEQAIQTAVSKQPRFEAKANEFVVSTMKWAKEMFEGLPDYSTESRLRSKWLSRFWVNEPYLAGLINSVVQIDRNRGWTLIGGRNQVLRFTDVLHNWQVQAGRASWRDGVGAMAQAFYTTDIGGMAEVGRQFKSGPMSGLFHLDPTRCVLSPNIEYPVKYYPAHTLIGKRMVEFAPDDYIRSVSAVNVDEQYNGLGLCALSRCIELAITMVAVYRHEQEMLFARAPKGLLLLKGISQSTWDNAMTIRDAALDNRQREWFGSVAVLAAGGMEDADAKMVALSQLPSNYDQEVFTNVLMYGYALCFGYDPREFWPVSSGSFGTVSETERQHASATSKGGKEFMLALQEELQGNLPETIHFEFDERDVSGDLEEANLQRAQLEVINAMGALLTDEQKLVLLAEQGLIPREWSKTEADVEATDVEDADSPDNETDIEETENEEVLQCREVQLALRRFPNEPLVIYRWDGQRGKVREFSKKPAQRSVFQIAKLMQRLAKEKCNG
jgi:hypothetical protein